MQGLTRVSPVSQLNAKSVKEVLGYSYLHYHGTEKSSNRSRHHCATCCVKGRAGRQSLSQIRRLSVGNRSWVGTDGKHRENEAELLLLAQPLSSVFINLIKDLVVFSSRWYINQKSLISAGSS